MTAVTIDPLRRTVYNDICTVINGTDQVPYRMHSSEVISHGLHTYQSMPIAMPGSQFCEQYQYTLQTSLKPIWSATPKRCWPYQCNYRPVHTPAAHHLRGVSPEV